MKITPQQIDELYKFTRQHYVEHYDVQTELVDHLANDIEQIWQEFPHLSFKEARDRSFKKFGIFGFMEVVEARQRTMSKRYRKIIWRFFKDWFTIPKIIITLCIFSSLYTLMSLNIDPLIFTFFMIVLGGFDVYYATQLNKKAQQRFQKNNKKFLLEEMIFKAGAFSSLIVFSNLFQLSTLLEYYTSTLGKSFIASILTIAILYSYISLIIVPKKAEGLLKETYPEYNLVKNM